jgi:hypothetical protein
MNAPVAVNPLQVKGRDCPTALCAYVFVWSPRPRGPKDKPDKKLKYSITLIWPENTDLSVLKKAASAAARKKWGDKVPPNLKTPFRIDPLFKDKVFISARTEHKQAVVDQLKRVIVNEMDFYSGCMAKVALTAFAYEAEGSKGVSFAMGPIQKISDGPRLAGGRDPDAEFDEQAVEGGAAAGGATTEDLF